MTGQSYARRLRVGDSVLLRTDTGNEMDKNPTAVIYEDKEIGLVRRPFPEGSMLGVVRILRITVWFPRPVWILREILSYKLSYLRDKRVA